MVEPDTFAVPGESESMVEPDEPEVESEPRVPLTEPRVPLTVKRKSKPSTISETEPFGESLDVKVKKNKTPKSETKASAPKSLKPTKDVAPVGEDVASGLATVSKVKGDSAKEVSSLSKKKVNKAESASKSEPSVTLKQSRSIPAIKSKSKPDTDA